MGRIPAKDSGGVDDSAGICFLQILPREIFSDLCSKYNHHQVLRLIHQVCESRKSSISWYFRRLGSSSSLLDNSSLKLVDGDDEYLEQSLLKFYAQLTNVRNVGK